MTDDGPEAGAEIDNLLRRVQQSDVRTYEFIARLAHELRAPLGSLLMWVHVLRMGREADREAALDAIDASARAQSKLIGNLLEVSRGLAGRLRIERLPVDLREPFHSAIEGAMSAASARRVQLNVAVGAGEFPVTGDALRLREVIAHLIGNAVKFSADGGAVDVTLSREGTWAQVMVRDRGPGISRQELSSIFDGFRLSAESATRAAGGLGLGLALVRLVTELHAGCVNAASDGLGQGSSFTLRVPLTEPDGVDQVATSP